MAKVLDSISLDAPAAPVTADVTDTFAFSGTPAFSGSGGVTRYDFKWEVDDGGGYVTIGASGTGLITADTNPVTNSNSQAQQSITVTCDTSGSYTVRMAGAPATGGSYTVFSATQTVEVSAGPELHSGTLSGTGGGVLTTSARKGATSPLVGTGAGLFTSPADSQRNAVLVGTGGGVATFTYETGSGSEAHSGALVATAGGVAVLGTTTDRPTALVATGGGVGTFAPTSERSSALTGTGAGAATLSGSTDRAATLTGAGGGVFAVAETTARAGTLTGTGSGVATFNGGSAESHSGALVATGGGVLTLAVMADRRFALTATGGGVATLSVESARYGAALMSGGGVLTSLTSTARSGVLTATGGGSATFIRDVTGPGLPAVVLATILGRRAGGEVVRIEHLRATLPPGRMSGAVLGDAYSGTITPATYSGEIE